ncbi:Structural maintenance of chromosomes protein 6 [Harpegnathos saltator]|uniref:Structural maintenance of chromosomes protein 6 n=1 Tax=Harpegnathos saltator TaxID=610380 RepID=E2BAB5_HARSA|nr:Structural maintenance of chromosomes protein 6 [Harpegnathos saltator]
MENTMTKEKRNCTNPSDHLAKRFRQSENSDDDEPEYTAGRVKNIRLRNFMCHDALEIKLNENVNFIVGRNGSGKSAILTALTVGLGARAYITNRGTSLKKFIKVGQTSAIIEITLTNKGDAAYKPETYGDVITIVRTIGPTSSYKIKNWRGEIISTKRDELDDIISSMNIQIDNPISILNQDVSRTFLISSKSEEKYNLFMKATLLDIIENNYVEALQICMEENEKLKQYYEALSQVKAEIEKLKDDIQKMEQMDESRAELTNLEERELPWAIAIEEETKLEKIQAVLNTHENNLKKLQDVESSVGTKNKEIDKKIKEIKEKILQTEKKMADSHEAYNSAKQKHAAAKEFYSNKLREWRSVENQIKRHEDDISLLKGEIQKLETCHNEQYIERKEMFDKLSKLEETLDEVEASMRTKQTELMHLEADNMRLSVEKQSAKVELDNCDASIRRLEKELSGFEQQSDNVLSVFGPNIPRLLRRIEEECKKGRFKEKPRGPIGAYIKMKDEAWAPAVESHLGRGILNSFCVDNNQDAKLLTSIMKEIFYNERLPQIITSKYYNQIHDVRRHCTQSPRYSNLLEAMIIEDPIVANCLIDQREIECILLIPTNQEACEIMSNAAKVPKNCKRAFTQQSDIYFPDPNYRTYGGKCGSRAKYLQVSSTEAMQTLKEELEVAKNKRQEAKIIHNAVCEKEERTKSSLNTVNRTVMKFKALQSRCKEEIDNLKDKIESNKGMSDDVFRHEITEVEKKITQERMAEKFLAEKTHELQGNMKFLDEEVKRCRDATDDLYTVIDPLKEQIKELIQKKEKHRFESQRSTQQLKEVRQAVQSATGEFQRQERVTTIAVANASEKCLRINTEKSINHIKSTITNLREKIREVEHQFGSVHLLQQQLQEKEEKYGMNIEFMYTLKKSCEKHIERVKHRQNVFEELRKLYGVYIQKSFSDVLALRQYKDKVNRRVIMDILLDHTKLHPESQFCFLTPLDTSNVLVEDYVTVHQLQPPDRRGLSQ